MVKKEKTQANIGFEKQIWDAACVLWGHIPDAYVGDNIFFVPYASPDLDKRVLGDVIDLFTNMDMGDTEESKDLLGRTYE